MCLGQQIGKPCGTPVPTTASVASAHPIVHNVSMQTRPHRQLPVFFAILLWTVLAAPAATPVQERADDFLALVNAGYQALTRVDQEAL